MEGIAPGSQPGTGRRVRRVFDEGAWARDMAQRRSAVAAHAFLRMVENGGKGKAHQADLVIVCDLRAYRRGHAEGDEVCHNVGGGPIP